MWVTIIKVKVKDSINESFNGSGLLKSSINKRVFVLWVLV